MRLAIQYDAMRYIVILDVFDADFFNSLFIVIFLFVCFAFIIVFFHAFCYKCLYSYDVAREYNAMRYIVILSIFDVYFFNCLIIMIFLFV